jgi:NAD(P)-dependent dehydrogenase (short-subunit alcohol dehydrogenase family)
MLKDKLILVLGASGLLGREVIKAIRDQQGNVIAVDLNTESLLDEYKNIVCHNIDITNEDEVKGLFSDDLNISGVVNCTYPRSSNYGKSFFDVSFASFNENLNLHLGSAFLVMQQSAAYFKRCKTPLSLVNLASIYGVVSPDFSIYENTHMTMPVEYAAIKSAIIHLNKYVSEFVSDSDFRVNSVSPGGIFDKQPEMFLTKYKNQTHGKGMLLAEDVMGSIVFLLSEQSRYITGQNIIIDDGFTL